MRRCSCARTYLVECRKSHLVARAAPTVVRGRLPRLDQRSGRAKRDDDLPRGEEAAENISGDRSKGGHDGSDRTSGLGQRTVAQISGRYEGHFASSCSSEPPSTRSDGHHVSVARSSTCLHESLPCLWALQFWPTSAPGPTLLGGERVLSGLKCVGEGSLWHTYRSFSHP